MIFGIRQEWMFLKNRWTQRCRKKNHVTCGWNKIAWIPPSVAATLVPSEKKSYRTHDWKICSVGKKELQNKWLENFGAIGKKTCRTRDWKILVPTEKNNCRTQSWCMYENFRDDACTKILVLSEKKNCKTRDWKILVLSEKTTAEHVAGKCWCRRKKRTHDWKICAVRKPWNTWLKKLLAFEKNICLPPNQIGNFYIMFTNSRRNYCNGMCSQMASANRQFEISP